MLHHADALPDAERGGAADAGRSGQGSEKKPSRKKAKRFALSPFPGGSGASKSALALVAAMGARAVGPVLSLRSSLAGCCGTDLHLVFCALENNEDATTPWLNALREPLSSTSGFLRLHA